MTDVVKGLSLLFDRPNEPMVSPKGDNNAIFQISEQFLVSNFQ